MPFASRAVAADARTTRPQQGDVFVFVSGERARNRIGPRDLALAGPPVLAWPVEPASNTVRDGSRLNQVLLLRLDPAELDEATRANAAEGITAYSASCTHAQCPVTGWDPDRQVLRCHCHNSEYDPRLGARVMFGPAPKPLPALPVRLVDGVLTAAGPFRGRVGHTTM